MNKKKGFMIKSFNPQNGIVFAKVVRAPSDLYCFVQNGDPTHIFCHKHQGGTLVVSNEGRLGINLNQPDLPMINDEIVLIRETNDRLQRGYTKAACWAMANEWQYVSWAVNAQAVFRAVAHNHRSNGKYQSNSNTDVVLASGKLIDIMRSHPRNAKNDELEKHHTSELGNRTLSHDVRWDRLAPDDQWMENDDPRPMHITLD